MLQIFANKPTHQENEEKLSRREEKHDVAKRACELRGSCGKPRAVTYFDRFPHAGLAAASTVSHVIDAKH